MSFEVYLNFEKETETLGNLTETGALETKTKFENFINSNAPSRCEHHKATASGGGNFTCSTVG